MKKTFKMTHEKIAVPRLFEAAKHEVSKYLKRERKKSLPEGADYWDFDCRFGTEVMKSEEIHLSEVNSSIDWAESEGLDSFYLEIIAKPVRREKSED